MRDVERAGRRVQRGERRAVRPARGSGRPATRPWTPRTQLNGFSESAEQLVDRARDLDAPDEVSTAHGLPARDARVPPRRPGARSPTRLPGALADQERRRRAPSRIAAAMQVFLASDVIYQARFVPSLERARSRTRTSAAERSRRAASFLHDLDWLQPAVVADQIASAARGERRRATRRRARPARQRPRHRHARRLALTPGGSRHRPAGRRSPFEVQVANQGENTETDVQREGHGRRGRRRHRGRGDASTRSPPARPRP